MPKIITENKGNIALLRLNNTAANAIDSELAEALSAAVSDAEQASQGIVLAGGEKLFSLGFHLPSLIELDRPGIADFFDKFNAVVLALCRHPFPTCCAIAGHAVAGGNILALACDFRIAASGKKFGLNEIKLGLPIPYLTDLILSRLVGPRAASLMAYGGEFLTTAQALAMGMVDEQVEPGNAAETRSIEKVAALLQFPAAAFAADKAYRTEPIRRAYEKERQARNQTFVDCWFSEPCKALLREAAKKF